MSADPTREGGVSVLAAMTGQVPEAPKAKAPKPRLTALPGEKNGASILTPVAPALPATPAAFPYDQPAEVIRAMIVDLERQRDALTGVIDGLRLLSGDPAAAAAVTSYEATVTAKLLEHEADRRAADAAKAAENPKDKVVAARVAEAEANPMAAVATAAEVRDRKRAVMRELLVEAGHEPDVAKIMADNDPATEPFPDRMARLQAEAQAHTFTQPEGIHGYSPVIEAATAAAAAGGGPREVMSAAMGAAGWVCPVHGFAVTKTSSRRNREYQGCPEAGCGEFERL